MQTHPTPDTPEDYCGTTYAAKLLGLSVGTIQTLVEKNELQACLSQEEIAARGGLPEGTIFMAKPVNLQWFNGFFTALIAGRKLEHQAA
jgi:hypothetical protein